MTLLIIATHPIQYQSPLYQMLPKAFAIPTTVIYGSDFSVAGYNDQEFGVKFAWDTNLLDGYESLFLSRVALGGAASSHLVSAKGITSLLKNQLKAKAILLLGYRFRFDLRAFWAAKQTGLPLLFRAETTDRAHARDAIKQTFRDIFLRWFYSQFSRVLYIGKNSLDHYQRLGCRDDQLVFSPYCVDTRSFQLDPQQAARLRLTTREALQLSSDRTILLFSGKLVPRKGPDLLIAAVKALPPEQRDRLTLLFLGDGEMRAQLEQTAAASQIEAHFVGFRNQTQLSSHYHAADALIMPSRTNETWGLVVNEALHHGLPCVVSDGVGCIPDLIKPGATGEIFVKDSITGLQSAIGRLQALIGQPNVKEQCQAAVAHYTVDAAAQGIAKAYLSIVNE